MTETNIEAVIRNGFRLVAIFDTSDSYSYSPARDRVIENATIENLGENGYIIRGNEVMEDIPFRFSKDNFFKTYDEAIEKWHKRSIEPVTKKRWHFKILPREWILFPFRIYRTEETIGWRAKINRWATLQNTNPVEIKVPANVPVVSYTDQVTLADNSMEILEE